MPGIGDEIDGAMQQAPQPILQSELLLLQTLRIFISPFLFSVNDIATSFFSFV